MSSSSRRRRQLQVRENNICSFLTPKSSNGENSEEGKVGKGLSIRTKGQKSASFRTEGDKETVEFFDDKEVSFIFILSDLSYCSYITSILSRTTLLFELIIVYYL